VQAEMLRAWGISDLQHNEHARVVIDFGDTGPATPGSEDLEDGWNFVASPQYGDAEDTMRTTTTVLRVAQGYDQFDSQPMPGSAPTPMTAPFNYPMGSSSTGPNLSAYAGYWVYADGSGDLTAVISSGVTIHEEGGLIVA
jgi:hypothetical protein